MQQEGDRFEEHLADGANPGEEIHHRQIDGAQGLFEAMVRHTDSEIDQIKRENERREKDRRFDEELKRQARLESIETEAQVAARKTAELEMRWSEYKEMEECQELASSLCDHRLMFKDLIGRKQKLIDSLKDHINFKNEEYIREIEKMKDDIDTIVTKMRKQFRELRELVSQELKNVEQDLSHQRGDLIGSMRSEITEKFSNHRKTEEEMAEARLKDEQDKAAALEATRIENDKKYMEVKIYTEIEIQNCEKCHEDMKALYKLNSEKLSYNYKVLTEKNDENQKLNDMLKAKKTDYSDQFKKKSEEYRSKHQLLNAKNKKLTKQYTSISRQYKDLHKKFKHFEQADTERYEEIRKMNLEEISKMKDRIKNCDRIIHQHQLGVVWEPFTEQDVINEELGRPILRQSLMRIRTKDRTSRMTKSEWMPTPKAARNSLSQRMTKDLFLRWRCTPYSTSC